MSGLEASAKSAEPDSRENSPDQDDSAEKRASKKRKVLSCYACRNRKMKCDRIYPVCGRCQKTGRADQCSYDPRLLEEAQVRPGQPLTTNGSTMLSMHDNGVFEEDAKADSVDALRWQMRLQERKIETLERKLAATSSNNHGPSQLNSFTPRESDIAEEMMFRGKGFKTQFHGTSSVMSTIAQYHDLRAFTLEALAADDSMSRAKNDFKKFRDRRKVLAKEKIARTYGTDDEIFALLPPKHEVDIQAALYFRTWETTYRILHQPTFWQEYNNFWQGRDERHAGFAATLVLIIALNKCTTIKDDVFIGDVTADRDAASNLIETCEMWLNRQPRKRLTLPYFQLQCLALIAKRVNCVKLKQDWLNTGDVMRLALAAGMHRDPSLLATGRISEYEKEMKKRLWYTIVELEIQSSLDSGLQSSLTGLYFDTPAPSNLPDEAFSLETKEMPASRPLECFTSTSYLITALKSLPLRIQLTKVLNDPTSQLQYADVLHYDEQISSAFSDLPIWTESSATVPSALLGLQHLQFLLVLHKPYAKLAPTEKRFAYSFTSCVETGSLMIDTHEDLASQGILVLNHFRNDLIRIGMTLSQVAGQNCTRHSMIPTSLPAPAQTHFADPAIHIADMQISADQHKHKHGFEKARKPTPPLTLATLPRQTLPAMLINTSTDILNQALSLFEKKVMRLGTGYMEHWLLGAAIALLPPSSSQRYTPLLSTNDMQSDLQSRIQTALNTFTALVMRVLSLQQHPSSHPLALTMDSSASPSAARTPSLQGERRTGTILSSRAAGSFGIKGVGAFAGFGAGDAGFDGAGGAGIGMGFDALGGLGAGVGEGQGELDGQLGWGWTFPDFWSWDVGGDF